MGKKKYQPRHQKAEQFLENSYSQNPHKEKCSNLEEDRLSAILTHSDPYLHISNICPGFPLLNAYSWKFPTC